VQLVASQISHRFGSLEVLSGIDFTVAAGEILAVIGPSGCGKSTLLSILGGLLAPTAGEALIQGEVPASSLNPLTYVFQEFALLPWRTVEGNVALALQSHALPQRQKDEMVAAALAMTGLGDFAKSFPKQLSGGMRQRCGIARALVVRPAVLLMDEPLSALDAQTRELLIEDFLAIWAREQTTAVYVTHNLDEALRLADRVVVLSRRPGVVKEIVAVPIPRPEQRSDAARLEIARLHDVLWRLIRNEAAVADREVSNV
jgi:NitT/TauT family transport system ATP-binding protein